ncbi:MAG: hypothetical protein PHQ33_05575 [Bacteroidales bacterium]|nr:hypothetical protein [Bacteroidales bacterium]
MKKALSITDIYRKVYTTLPLDGEWREAFSTPEAVGTWIIWGNSGNGKSTFAMQLCGELCKYGRVLYNSLEEGTSLTFRNKLEVLKNEVELGTMNIVCESMQCLSERLKRRRSADFVVIDSYQYCGLTYREYLDFKNKHKDKLLIFISHADGRNPSGRSAKSVMFDASLKIWVEGYKAFSKGRFIGANGGIYTIWKEGAEKVWGVEN